MVELDHTWLVGRPAPQRSTSVRLRRWGGTGGTGGARSEFVKNRRSGEWSERRRDDNIVDTVCDGEGVDSWSRCSARRSKASRRMTGVEFTDFGMIDGDLPCSELQEDRLIASSGGSCGEQVG